MRIICLLITITFLTACATIDFQPYEGNSAYEGSGGTKVVVDGVDFWANGAPPRKFKIIGVVTSEIGSGYGDEALIRSSVASEVIKQGGNAAIQLNSNSSFAGIVKVTPSMYMAAGVKQMQFSIIRYID
ncbi:MAG: hypothetical protein RLZZ601_1741 [Pseudomonadota bacterium]|jgi:hypothetical protein